MISFDLIGRRSHVFLGGARRNGRGDASDTAEEGAGRRVLTAAAPDGRFSKAAGLELCTQRETGTLKANLDFPATVSVYSPPPETLRANTSQVRTGLEVMRMSVSVATHLVNPMKTS